jgi:hypothetical protein
VETLKIVSGFLPRTMCAVVLPFKRLLTLLALDPLVELHDADENDNTARRHMLPNFGSSRGDNATLGSLVFPHLRARTVMPCGANADRTLKVYPAGLSRCGWTCPLRDDAVATAPAPDFSECGRSVQACSPSRKPVGNTTLTDPRSQRIQTSPRGADNNAISRLIR